MRTFATAVVAVVALLAWSGSAAAQTQSQPVEYRVTVEAAPIAGATGDHFLTFDGPIGLPGVGLAPGTYVFRIFAPSVMQVLNKEQSAVYATFFTLPVRRADVTTGYDASFAKVDDTAPMRLIKWFEPNKPMGYELRYADLAGDTER